MAKVGAQRAAELTGKSKSTVQRAMKSGKISFELDHNNRRVIDVAELERAFGLVPLQTNFTDGSAETDFRNAKDALETERLHMKVKFLEEQIDLAKEQIDDLKVQREQWQKQAQQVLLTSQYSQKQAEELKTEIKERERRFRAYKKQELERHGMAAKSKSPLKNSNVSSDNSKSVFIQSLWYKILGTPHSKDSKAA